ncbi:MAG: valine--tRNA ligase [Clostridia bacterium]
MEKSYQPELFEKELYNSWQVQGLFTPKVDTTKKPFTIVIPPPNITDQLHIGHAYNNSLQDCIIRYKRLKGYNTLWLPGTDHASIATEVKIINQLSSEGLDKDKIGREEFLRRAYLWNDKYGSRIIEQLKELGCSCDWSRTAFTMDEKCSKAVKEVFVKLYNKKLIYQGSKIINWCPHCKTALSDAEVEYEEKDSFLWHFKYFSVDGKESLEFATTRPETMLGDTALAVNPTDKRYSKFIGKKFIVPFVNREIPVVADNYVEKDFGTGVVKITPAHDPNDFEVGLRHDLPLIKILNDDGTMNQNAQQFANLDRYVCRKQIVDEMTKLGQCVKIEPYKHNVGSCYRCNTVIEPIISKQWFVSMGTLAKPAIKVVKEGKVKFIPKRFDKIYFDWMENIKDWCISRQLWWGHRIPVWYCQDCKQVICQTETPTKCCKCGGTNLQQDNDVLDTWFSSALWPFSTLGYPEKTADLNYFFPTDVLVTMYDLIFFWVARMIFSSIENMGDIPFNTVLIHGMVKDELGRKMSKSLGNGVDPVPFIQKFGADTLRFSLINGVSIGNDMKFNASKVENTRNFMNKIWNASRFVLMNCLDKTILPLEKCKLNLADKWILSKLNNLIKDVTKNMDNYELGIASTMLYDFMWSEFCDWYIEFSKPILYGTDDIARQSNLSVLVYVLDKLLKMLHPFIPFITEKIYQDLPNASGTIMNQTYPIAKRNYYKKQENLIEIVKDAVSKIRFVRAENKVAPSKRIRLFISLSLDLNPQDITAYIEKLTNSTVSYVNDCQENGASLVTTLGEIFIPLGDMVDVEKEIARIEQEIEKANAELTLAQGKLSNQRFIDKAPVTLVEAEKQKVQHYTEIIVKLTEKKNNLVNN